MEVKNLDIVFEDDYLIVVNKKSGLLVLPTPKREKVTLTNILNTYLKSKKEESFPCHRLDKDTSGLIIYAKDKKSQQDIMNQFRKRLVRKKYLAIVQGRIEDLQGVIKGYVKPKGKPKKFALTKFKVLRRFKKFSILEVEPKTGRTNQIRIHFSQISHPIVGERKYAIAKNWPLRFKRLCLHSYFIQFRHPESKDLIFLKADIPQDIKNFLKEQAVELTFRK